MASDAVHIFGIERADWPLAGVGCALAVGLTVAAGAMILRDDRRPHINGADHLALFARPAQLHEQRMRAQSLPPIPAPPPGTTDTAPVAAKTIDFAPTASIAPPPVAALQVQQPNGESYVLLKATRDRATFRGRSGDLVVKKGDVVPGLGQVTAFAFRDKAWTVVLDRAGAKRSRR